MFILLTIEDKIILNPSELNPNHSLINIPSENIKLPSIANDQNEAEKEKENSQKQPEAKLYNEIIYERLRKKYIGKILLGQGLVVTIQKFSVKSNLIVEIEGMINVEYECSLIVFKPAVGDILYGKIIESTINQITVDLGYIKVKIPSEQIMKPNNFDEKENVWFWTYGDNNYYYDIGEECRVKVLEVTFKTKNEISNILSYNSEVEKQIENEEAHDNEIGQQVELTMDMIMEINCAVNEEGLGPLKWWGGK